MIINDAEWLRLVPREKSEAEVHLAEERRDRVRGPYTPHEPHHHHPDENRH